MRAWFSTFVLLVAAVALALVLREHGGNVLIIAQPWRIEMSLTLAVLLLIALFVVVYMALRLLDWIAGGPSRWRHWRRRRVEQRDSELLETGWLHVLEGRYPQAEKLFGKLLKQSRSRQRRVLGGLALSRALSLSGNEARIPAVLEQVREDAQGDLQLREASAVVAAELALDRGDAAGARALLLPLQDASSNHFHATRLLVEACRQLGEHDRVYELTRVLLRRGAISKARALALIEVAAADRLRAAGPEGFKLAWSDLKAEERALPAVALAGAAMQSAAGQHDEAARTLEQALQVSLDARLLHAYADGPPEQVARRMAKAEAWLKREPDHPVLLATLGRLCLTGALWGQAEHYLSRSLAAQPADSTHALLGTLYDRVGRATEAAQQWRLASGVADRLPALAQDVALPAADTAADPVRSGAALPAASVNTAPAAASAADYLAETDAAAPVVRTPPPASAVAQPSAVQDEYFDSAPIPGVTLSDAPRDPHRS